MANFEILKRLGLFIQQDFLDREFLASCTFQPQNIDFIPARVYQNIPGQETVEQTLDEKTRKTKMLQVERSKLKYVRQRLREIKPALEEYFDLTLTDCEIPQFYLYEEGSFFKPHFDQAAVDETIFKPEDKIAAKRQVSVVIFLNTKSEEVKSSCYGGGALTFYGLIESEKWMRYGFPLFGEPGMIAAFRSNVLHEVKPVTHGERYTIVSWFF